MVHTVVIRPHGPHRLSLSGKGDRKEEERGGDGEEDGGIKASRNCMSDNGRWKRSGGERKRGKEEKAEVKERFPHLRNMNSPLIGNRGSG